jgi:SPP1 gp7 family putative phage head morphogenesis protein
MDNSIRAALITVIKSRRQKMSRSQRRRGIKPQRWLYPWATEVRYAATIRAWLRPMKTYVHSYLKENQEAILRGDSSGFHADSVSALRLDAVPGKSFKKMIDSLNGWQGQYVPNDDESKSGSPIYMGLGNIADSVFDFNEGQFEKGAKTALGVEFPVGEDWWPFARDIWANRNYDLIKSDMKNYIGQINALTEKSVTSGWSVKTLREQIMTLDGKITKSRANFIARDQIGKLNGEITQRRMESVGLTMYIWETSGDERVRPSHEMMDGGLCKWGDSTVYSQDGGKTWIPRPSGAVFLHPGADYQCRCTATSYWDELVGEADAVIAQYEELDALSAANIAAMPKQEARVKAEKRKMPKNPFEQRFGNKTANFIKTSMEYIDDVKLIPDSVNKELEQALKRLNKTPEQYIAEVNEFISNGKIVRHDRLDRFIDNIDNLERDPRIKTQFETGTSQGAVSLGLRNFWERKLIGKASNYGWKPVDSDKTDYGIAKADRPVYAEVTRFHPLEANAGEQYGDISFVLSGKIRERTSFTLDNSSVEGVGSFKSDAHSIFSKPEINARQNVDNFYQAQRKGSDSYVEAQVWGGIDLSKRDVEAVVIEDSVFVDKKDNSAFNRFLKVMRDNHVSVIKSSEWENTD